MKVTTGTAPPIQVPPSPSLMPRAATMITHAEACCRRRIGQMHWQWQPAQHSCAVARKTRRPVRLYVD